MLVAASIQQGRFAVTPDIEVYRKSAYEINTYLRECAQTPVARGFGGIKVSACSVKDQQRSCIARSAVLGSSTRVRRLPQDI